jgi:hypothetical protein
VGCPTTSEGLKKYTMFADNWLEEKSDVFQSAYIAASCNMVGLTERLKEAKGDFRHYPNMPNAPLVLVSFPHSTDYERTVPADSRVCGREMTCDHHHHVRYPTIRCGAKRQVSGEPRQ